MENKKPRFSTDSLIANELLRLNKECGGILTPAEVVEAAKHKNSPLHDYFDWSDNVAARKWRLHQARNLMRVCVWYDETKQIEDPVKVFISLTTDRRENEGYRVVTDVMNDEEYRKQLLSDAITELISFQKKYSILQELSRIFEEIRKLAIPIKVKVPA